MAITRLYLGFRKNYYFALTNPEVWAFRGLKGTLPFSPQADRERQKMKIKGSVPFSLPLFEMRAKTMTEVAVDSFMPGAIALLSSKLKLAGKSPAFRLKMASGIREPCSARAKIE